MRVVCLLVMAVVCSLGAFADGTSAQLSNAETVCVKGKGVGKDKAEALKDAYRDAVERAVGVFVDAEQMMANEQLLKDQILTSSNAYIERYEEKKLITGKDGMVEVTIVAWVRRTELTHKLRDVMPTVTANVSEISQNLYAEIVSKDKRDADAETLLKNIFDDFDPLADLMKVTVVTQKPEVSPSKESNDAKVLSYQLKFEIDPDKYFKTWAPHMDKILSQISLSPGKEFSFKKVRNLSNIWREVISKTDPYDEMPRTAYFAYDKMYFVHAKLLDTERFVYGQERWVHQAGSSGCVLDRKIREVLENNRSDYIYKLFDAYYCGYHGGNKCVRVRRGNSAPKMKAKSKLYIALVKHTDKRGCSGMVYELSDSSVAVISRWMSSYYGIDTFDDEHSSGGHETSYRVKLSDDSGNVLANGECCAFNHKMGNIGSICWGDYDYCYENGCDKPEKVIPYVIYMTPWVGCFAGECSTWIDVEVDTKDIGQIATVSVTPEKK